MVSLYKLNKTKQKNIKNYKLGNYPKLMELIGGINDGEMITIGARVGCGKTSFALNLCCEFSDFGKCLFCSFEMNKQSLFDRIKLSYALTDNELNNIFIEDNSEKMTIIWLEQMIKEHHFKFIFIDYLQIFNGKIKVITRELKKLCLKYNVVMVCLAQLNRKAQDKEPNLSMLKDSGTIEQDSDEVWFIKEYHINVAKNRKGMVGEVDIIFDKSNMNLYESTERIDNIKNIALETIKILCDDKIMYDYGCKMLENLSKYNYQLAVNICDW